LRVRPRFEACGSRCWVAEVRPPDLGVFVPAGPLKLQQAVAQAGALLVMTGTYYDPGSGKLCGLLRAHGQRWGWQPQGRPVLAVWADPVQATIAVATDVPEAELVIGGGPVLVAEGELTWQDSYRQGGYSGLRPASRVPRVALGIRSDGLIVALVAEALPLGDLARVCRDWLSCRDAMALDGGGSACLAWQGEVLCGGRRPLPSYVVAGEWSPPTGGGDGGPGNDSGEVSRRLNDFPVAPDFRLFEFESPDTGTVRLDPLLVDRLQALRDRVGRPVVITSGYRTMDHNRTIGGAPESLHLRGQAADIKVPGWDPEAVARADEAVGFGGIGVCPTHVHVDVRPGKARW